MILGKTWSTRDDETYDRIEAMEKAITAWKELPADMHCEQYESALKWIESKHLELLDTWMPAIED